MAQAPGAVTAMTTHRGTGLGAALAVLLLVVAPQATAAEGCGAEGVALQVLGSGGPIADDGRASTGYLIWNEGRARALVDAGGGVFLRFGEAGARLEDLELLALTHLHTDHAAALPALLKGGYFSPRRRALAVSGPDGNHLMPGVEGFLEALFAADGGAFRYLDGFLEGTEGLFALEPITVPATTTGPVEVWRDDGLVVHAVGVHHGPIPTLGYDFELGGRRIVISGDQNLSTTHLASLAAGADMLVMPMAIPQDAGSVARNLHATPSAIGRFAGAAAPGHLVLSHLMARSLDDLKGQIARVRDHYGGALTVAEDLQCIPAHGS